MSKQIVIEHLGQSAIVTIDNPPANVWTLDSLQQLALAMDALDADEQVRAVVITGAGDKFFSAGADLQQFARGDRQMAGQVADAFALAFNSIRQFRGVTVAAVNGFALGGGLECALACDYIVAERGARLGLPETSVGQLPCAGGTKTLADRVGLPWAKRIILGGETVTAEQALHIGLVEEVVDPGLAKIMAVSMAGKVARQGRLAVLAARQLIEGSQQMPLDRQLLQEKAAFLALMGGTEQQEGVGAFLAKRKPAWVDEDEDN
ncbi:enoyl-CoA hydratase [Vogesella sp. LIG4]|uniref:enoyl-CoA hydratase n=1 Tax=Vogesella sp. LIG4 TaxID=1192162 RepID=UPI000820243F|nr:enoyl-CoA hydratase [Vogesella sp. LIG4]SCK26316.1 Enoyl-CoA hydratase/carnithine racemase [Vogesella sp. LIG4]